MTDSAGAPLHCASLHSISKTTVLCSALVVLSGCADGGSEDRPQSAVKITTQHHLFGLRSLRGFGSLPIQTTVTLPDRGRLNLFDDSSYTITRGSDTSGADRYAIGTDRAFSVFITGSAQEPSVVFRGAYGYQNTADPGAFFFTDRVSTNASPSVGLYYGMPIVAGQVELEGAWHLLSLHAIFGQSLLQPDNVARGVSGAVTVTAGGPGTARTISGTGLQGASGVVFGGTIQNVLDGSNNGDGTCNLTLSYQVGSAPLDSRAMQCVASSNLALALDEDESDGEAGIAWLVRKFDAPTSPVDPVRVTGTFLVGGHTFFVNPSNSGSDAFVGTVVLGTGGAFRLDAAGANGTDFTYTGTYSLAQDGGMTITIPGTSETWFAAIDRSYQTLVFVDGIVETRANNIPELNIGFGVRQRTN